MQSPFSFGPLCTPIALPMAVRSDIARVVPVSVERKAALETAHRAVKSAIFRPTDIGTAELGWPLLAWVPYWCVHVDVAGLHIGIRRSGKKNRFGGFVPMPGMRHKDAVVSVPGRPFFPFAPELRAPVGTPARRAEWMPPLFHGSVSVPGFSIDKAAMVPADTYTIPRGEIVQPDVRQDAAEDQAKGWLRDAVQPSDAIYARYEPVVRSSVLCHYPMYVTRYQYEGSARGAPGEVYFVTVSGHDGKVVARKHPAWWRAVRSWLPGG